MARINVVTNPKMLPHYPQKKAFISHPKPKTKPQAPSRVSVIGANNMPMIYMNQPNGISGQPGIGGFKTFYNFNSNADYNYNINLGIPAPISEEAEHRIRVKGASPRQPTRVGDKIKTKDQVHANIAKLLQKKRQIEDTGGDYTSPGEAKGSVQGRKSGKLPEPPSKPKPEHVSQGISRGMIQGTRPDHSENAPELTNGNYRDTISQPAAQIGQKGGRKEWGDVQFFSGPAGGLRPFQKAV